MIKRLFFLKQKKNATNKEENNKTIHQKLIQNRIFNLKTYKHKKVMDVKVN